MAVQITEVVPTGKVAGALLVMETTRTLSVAVAFPIDRAVNSLVASKPTIFAGAITTGGMVSATVNFLVTVLEFPALSNARTVTMVSPAMVNVIVVLLPEIVFSENGSAPEALIVK